MLRDRLFQQLYAHHIAVVINVGDVELDGAVVIAAHALVYRVAVGILWVNARAGAHDAAGTVVEAQVGLYAIAHHAGEAAIGEAAC